MFKKKCFCSRTPLPGGGCDGHGKEKTGWSTRMSTKTSANKWVKVKVGQQCHSKRKQVRLQHTSEVFLCRNNETPLSTKRSSRGAHSTTWVSSCRRRKSYVKKANAFRGFFQLPPLKKSRWQHRKGTQGKLGASPYDNGPGELKVREEGAGTRLGRENKRTAVLVVAGTIVGCAFLQ